MDGLRYKIAPVDQRTCRPRDPAGTVPVNCFSEGDMTTPFGGYKESGFAGRDKSIFAHEEYTELKTWMAMGETVLHSYLACPCAAVYYCVPRNVAQGTRMGDAMISFPLADGLLT